MDTLKTKKKYSQLILIHVDVAKTGQADNDTCWNVQSFTDTDYCNSQNEAFFAAFTESVEGWILNTHKVSFPAVFADLALCIFTSPTVYRSSMAAWGRSRTLAFVKKTQLDRTQLFTLGCLLPILPARSAIGQ